MLFCVLFVCKCVLYYCHCVLTQLPSTNVYHKRDIIILEWDSMDWILLAQDEPLMGCCEHGEEPFISTKCESFFTI